MSAHYDDAVLAALQGNSLPADEAARVREHVRSCTTCRARMPENVVAFDRERRVPNRDRVREFADTARRLQRERESSLDAVARLLRATPRDEWPRLAEVPEMRTSGALEQLSTEIRRRLEKDPSEAMTLSTLATTIAETLPADSYPPVVLAQTRAHAWKDRAHAFCYLSMPSEAYDAIERAETILAPFPGAAYDRAVVRFVKATTLQHFGQYDESLWLLSECRAVFSELGDTRLYLYCGIAEGNVFYRREQFAEARLVFAPLVATAKSLGDIESEARLQNNLGYCATQLDELKAANVHFSEAVARFYDLGRTAEALRTERGAGVLLISKGHVDRGIERLTAAREQLLGRGLVEEAGLCGLVVVEALTSRGDSSGARALAAAIGEEFAAAEVGERAVAALESLRLAFDHHEASPELVRQVQTYLEDLRRDPARQMGALR